MADDALAVADAEALDRFHLVGRSMGGLIAQAVALHCTRRSMMNLIMPPGFITAANEAEWAARLGSAFEPIAMPQLKAMSCYNATASPSALVGLPTLVLSGAHHLIARAPLGLASRARGHEGRTDRGMRSSNDDGWASRLCHSERPRTHQARMPDTIKSAPRVCLRAFVPSWLAFRRDSATPGSSP